MKIVQSIKLQMNKKLHITFTQHENVKDVLYTFFKIKYPKETKKSIFEKTISSTFFSEKPKRIKIKALVKNIYKYGVWGYHESNVINKQNEHEIHYWCGTNMDQVKLYNFLGHELAHAMNYLKESDAVNIGNICALTFYCVSNHKFKKLKKGKNHA